MSQQIEHCTPEEKQHMVDLIKEMREYIVNMAEIKRSIEEQNKAIARLREIGKEMKAFRRRYPLD